MPLAKKKKSRDDGIFISFVDEPASEQVTGSMIYISTSTHNILVEAGCAQSNNVKEDYLVNNRKFSEFKPKNIDLIFVPEENYEEAIQVKNEYNYNMKIIKVHTFDEVINYLKNN